MQTRVTHQCPICGGNSATIGRIPTISPEEHTIVELRSCDRCGHWWHSPMPVQDCLSDLYRSESPLVVPAGAKLMFAHKGGLDPFQHSVLAEIASRSRQTYLEIGVGGGQLLRKVRSMGHHCYGVDPGQWVEDGSVFMSVEEVPSDTKFQIFVLHDVLEHLSDPGAMMSALRSMASHDAVAFCSFPCCDSRPAKVQKERWPMIRPYGHLHYFSFDSCSRMLHKAGWQIKQMKLERIIPLWKTVCAVNIRALAYEIVKGGRDQLYVMATV